MLMAILVSFTGLKCIVRAKVLETFLCASGAWYTFIAMTLRSTVMLIVILE